jgi:hypothetical protein
MSLCLINYAVLYEDLWWTGGIAPQFLILTSDGAEWSAALTPEKRPCYLFYRRLGVPHSPVWTL